jgi:DNA polymerase III subunit delta
MKLKSSDLTAHLKHHALAPVYLIYGEEPLQAMECADTLRAVARTQEYSERIVFTVENQQFDWKTLHTEAASLSLFARKRLLEVRLGDKIPADKDSKTFTNGEVLLAYLHQPAPDTILLLSCGKLDSKAQKNAWFNAVDRVGVIVAANPIESSKMPEWIRQRLSLCGLKATSEAVQLLAERAEGHLLAAAQEIEKLNLLYPGNEICAEHVLESVADSARFEVFAWLDVVLAGQVPRLTRQLRSLRAGGTEVSLISLLLERDVRTLCLLAQASSQAAPQVLLKLGVWGTRKNLFTQAVRRYKPHAWSALLMRCNHIDRMIKGMEDGNPWDEVLNIAVHIAGLRLVYASA